MFCQNHTSRNSTLLPKYTESYRYGFSGKEKDDEIYGNGSSYDFGARMYNPRLGRWMSTDPLANEYPMSSPYAFCLDNPISSFDPDGEKVIFVNGYYNTGDGTMPEYIAENLIGTVGGSGYWGSTFKKAAMNYFDDQSSMFVDGRGEWSSSGEDRYNAGYEWAKANFETLKADMVEGETFKVVSHSMGSAYSEGMIKYIEEQGMTVEQVVHLSAADPSDFTASSNPYTLQLNLENDAVLYYKNFWEYDKISGVDRYGEVNTNRWFYEDWASSHADTKFDADVWKMVDNLSRITMKQTNNCWVTPFGTWCGYSNTYDAWRSGGTQFNDLYLNGSYYEGTDECDEYTK